MSVQNICIEGGVYNKSLVFGDKGWGKVKRRFKMGLVVERENMLLNRIGIYLNKNRSSSYRNGHMEYSLV